jgi:hypothetical protein
MKTSVKVRLGLGVLVIGVLAFVTVTTTPWGSANLATCRIVEADQLANDRLNEGDPPVAPVPPPGELFACEVLFPDSHPFTLNPSLVVVDLVFFGGIGTAIYLRHRRRFRHVDVDYIRARGRPLDGS